MKKEKIFQVEIKSEAVFREGKKSFITYFSGNNTKLMASNCRYLYPQYMKPEDNPVVGFSEISQEEYEERKNGGPIKQKSILMGSRGHIL
jgi:hypothetical protein